MARPVDALLKLNDRDDRDPTEQPDPEQQEPRPREADRFVTVGAAIEAARKRPRILTRPGW